MPGFTTTEDGSWSFSLEDKPDVPDLPVHDPLEILGPFEPSYLKGAGKWENYSDPVLYELESLLRKWLETKLSDPEWTAKGAKGIRARKYTTGMVYESLYGKPYNGKDQDCLVRVRRLPKLLAYYSIRIQKEGTIRGSRICSVVWRSLAPSILAASSTSSGMPTNPEMQISSKYPDSC